MTEMPPMKFLEAPGYAGSRRERLAYKSCDGAGPAFIWCGGLKSDMEGGKALHLHDWAQRSGRAYVRFDYFGHGESSGHFRDGTISRWARDAVQIIDDVTTGDIVLVGSSMGGWASLLAMLERPERVKGLILIAPAPDFTEKLMWANFSEEAKRAVMEDGIHYEPSDYDEPYEYSRELIEDGRKIQLLDTPINFDGPVRILQGVQDDVVPWTYSHQLLDVLTSDDISMTLVKSGDHSLSRPEDLARLEQTAEEVCAVLGGA